MQAIGKDCLRCAGAVAVAALVRQRWPPALCTRMPLHGCCRHRRPLAAAAAATAAAQLRLASEALEAQLWDARVRLAVLANRQVRLDNPMLEERIRRLGAVLADAAPGAAEAQQQEDGGG